MTPSTQEAVTITDAAWQCLQGAYDVQIHVGPDVIPRRIDDIDCAKEFLARGLKGFVLKSHYVQTGERAQVVRKAVPGAAIGIGPGTAPWTDHTRMRGPLAGSRLRDDTGFRPQLDLERGIAAFAEWMREHREAWA